MSRFNRDNVALPNSLDSAADQLKETVESQVREIVGTAEARAAEIEDAALHRAAERERESINRAEEIFNRAVERSTAMVETIELLEGEIGVVIAALKSETESLRADLETARASAIGTQAAEPAAASPTTEPAAETDADVGEAPASIPDQQQEGDSVPAEDTESDESVASADVSPDISPDVSPDGESGADLREMLAAQISDMYRAGRPRAEAERFLTRFKQGEHHIDLLDEIYTEREDQPTPSPAQPAGRRLRRRRRRR